MVDKFSAALGSRLRAARRHRGWSLSEVENITEGEFKASVVGAYERGERAISVHRLVNLAEVYAMNPADLLPIIDPANHVIDLDLVAASDGDISERYIAAIHLLRGSTGSHEIRASDRVVLSSLLELESQKVASEN